MPFDLGLLSDASLEGLSDKEKSALQQQATKQFLVGSLLGGDPSMAFRSAINVPADYYASQNRMIDLAEKQRQKQAEDAWAAKYNPTKYQETSPEFTGPVSPDIAASQTGIGQARAAGLPTQDINAALRDLTVLRSPRQAQMLEGFKASLPKVGEGGTLTAAGGQYLGTIPQFSPSQNMIYGANVTPTGQVMPYSMPIPGGEQGRAAAVRAETIARETSTPRAGVGQSGAQIFTYPPAPPGYGGVGGGQEAPQTEADRIRLEADKKRYGEFSAQSSDAALTATDRRLAGERIYSLADRIDGNKFTNLTADAAGYMRALPFVGEKFDQYVSDVSLFNRDRAQMVLRGLSNVKGNANETENRVVSQASVAVTDPKISTKWVAALEMAAADKDVARQNFVENYKGDPGKIQTAWQNSPDNPRIYNNPKVNQFLTEQVQTWAAKPNKSANEAPVLPAGFQFGMSKDGSTYKIKKPDGSVMTIGAQ